MGGEITPRKNAITAAKILKVLAVLLVGAGDCFSSFANSLVFVTFFFGGMVAGWGYGLEGGRTASAFSFSFACFVFVFLF